MILKCYAAKEAVEIKTVRDSLRVPKDGLFTLIAFALRPSDQNGYKSAVKSNQNHR